MDFSYIGHCFTEHLPSWAGGEYKTWGYSWGKGVGFKLLLMPLVSKPVRCSIWYNLICSILGGSEAGKGKPCLPGPLTLTSLNSPWAKAVSHGSVPTSPPVSYYLHMPRWVWCATSCDQGVMNERSTFKFKLQVTGKSVSLAIHNPDNPLRLLVHSGLSCHQIPVLPVSLAPRTGAQTD